MSDSSKTVKMSEAELQDLVIESDTGARKPSGFAAKFMITAALLWSLFQLWIASPLPYMDFFSYTLNIPIFNSTYARYIHLTFALSLAFASYPAFKRSPRDYVPIIDWGLIVASIISVIYLYILRDELALRSGLPTQTDIVISAVGIVVLLEAARRALGPPLVIIAVIFLAYTFGGNMAFIPELIAHKGQSISKVASHQWLTTEGVFGIAIGVSTDFVFLFVLFGALLERAGAGNYFIKLAFSLLGHMRGGPAKAAVLASGMTGLISGSSIANVVTTGTFTVPLMRRVGFSREKAGAVEVAASVNGQIMPPVMGAAAFLMTEYVGIPYLEVVKAAFLPAIISYIALLYMVHLEAVKNAMKPIPKERKHSVKVSMMYFGITVSSMLIIAGLSYWIISGLQSILGDWSLAVIVILITATYVALLWLASKSPPLEVDNPNSSIIKLPQTWETAKTGFHYILPIVVLIWCLMVERLSPGLSAFWATVFMITIVITQHPIITFFRKSGDIKEAFTNSLIELLDGLVTGARNMTGIAVATAAAGIIVGVVSLTGVGQSLTELVELLAGGSFILVLLYTAVICLILGMGLPTTANYMVVANLMAPVVAELGAQNGLVIPLIAVHLFVFYFGIMADVTPPVGLASFAAAAVSGGDPIKTGIQAFVYSIRTVILPFIFIYNTDLLLIGVNQFWIGFSIFLKATFAMLIFAAATQGYFIVRNKKYETIILLLIAFSFLRPGFWVEMVTPEYTEENVYKMEDVIKESEPWQKLKINVIGINKIGDPRPFSVYVDFEDEGTAKERLHKYGLILGRENGNIIVDDVLFNSSAEKDGFDFDNKIDSIEISQRQMSRNWVYAIAMLIFIFVTLAQRSRKIEFYSED